MGIVLDEDEKQTLSPNEIKRMLARGKDFYYVSWGRCSPDGKRIITSGTGTSGFGEISRRPPPVLDHSPIGLTAREKEEWSEFLNLLDRLPPPAESFYNVWDLSKWDVELDRR